MKRLLVFSDGTWQSLANTHPTSVVRLLLAVPAYGPGPGGPVQQLVYYREGVGTRNVLERWLGGAFGWGLDAEIADAYRFLSLNYEPGDEIHLFGFSRGAYTVRSLAGLINKCGILHRRHITHVPDAIALYRDRGTQPGSPESGDFRRKYSHPHPKDAFLPGVVPPDDQASSYLITLLVCWDTVGSLGVPDIFTCLPFDKQINRKYAFHDHELSPIVRHALHALSIDEASRAFDCTLMKQNPDRPAQLSQRWFAGDHGCMGGGSREKEPLANFPLAWILSEMKSRGLLPGLLTIPGGTEGAIATEYPPATGFWALLDRLLPNLRDLSLDIPAAAIDESVHERWKLTSLKSPYRPRNLQLDAEGRLVAAAPAAKKPGFLLGGASLLGIAALAALLLHHRP
jgi:uncharacterized protein (DUF2235 family)